METNLEMCVGIDCAATEHEVCLSKMLPDKEVLKVASLTISNSKNGFVKLEKWMLKQRLLKDTKIVLEATGVYHESLAMYLFDQGWNVSVVLPSMSKSFSKTLKQKSVNDKLSSYMLSIMGLEKKLDKWKKPDPLFRRLRNLTRERGQITAEQTAVKNQLHAESCGAWPDKSAIKRMKDRLKMMSKQVKEIEKELKLWIEKNPGLKKKVENITSIHGVGLITTVSVIAETDGFNLIRKAKQLVSFAGLDVIEKQSGTSVRGKSRISKKGNSYLRKALYFPAISAVKKEGPYKNLYTRIFDKSGIKMKGSVAVQRKILILMYILWKTDKKYDINYHTNELGQPRRATLNELA